MNARTLVMRSAGRRTFLLMACGLAVGCAGDGPPPAGGGTYATIQTEIFDAGCTQQACHSAAGRAGDLSLTAGESYDELVDVEAANPTAAAAGLLRVDPFLAQDSFLMRKLTGDLSPGEGSAMPIGAMPLSPEQLALIADWIEAGAEPDPEPAAAP